MLPVTPVGPNRHLVGKNSVGGPGQVPDPVDPLGSRRGRSLRHGVGPAVGISAQVGVITQAHAEQDAIIGVGRVDVLDLAPSVDGAGKMLLPVFHPLDRPARPHRQNSCDEGFRVGIDFAAEAATDVPGQDPQLVFRESQHLGDEVALQMRGLGGQPHGHVAGAPLVAGHNGSGLHGVGNQPGLHQTRRYNPVGLAKRLVRVSRCAGSLNAKVGTQLFVDQGRAVLRRRLDVHHGGQRVVVHVYQFQCVFGSGDTGGQHHGHRFPHVFRHVDGHGPSAFGAHPVLEGEQQELALAMLLYLRPGQHRQHFPQLHRLGRVDAANASVGVGAAEDRHVSHAP